MSQEDRDNLALCPSDAVKKRLFFLADVGAEATELYEQAWAEVLAAKGRQ